MKRIVGIIIFIIIMLSYATVTYANSGPVYWPGRPSSGVVSTLDNCPIIVNNETLVFDFSDGNYASHTISGKVAAAYEMLNPTNQPQSVLMAFPIIGRMNELSPDRILITVDENILPYDVYIGEVIKGQNHSFKGSSFDFTEIVETISNEIYQADTFNAGEKGILYTIEVKPANERDINLVVEFSLDENKTRVLTNGFNRYERNGRETLIAAWCRQPEILEIFVLGEDIDFNLSAYTDGQLGQKTDLYKSHVSRQEVKVETYLLEMIKNQTPSGQRGFISDTQLYNLYARTLEQGFIQNMGYCSSDDLIGQEHSERLLTLVYSVDFPENSQREVKVNYHISGTMDKRKTPTPLYTFDYILNPAENWNDFKNLKVKIMTPLEAPYIVDSSIDLTQEKEMVYTAEMVGLPDNDLSFTLYSKEKVTALDKVQGYLQNRLGYFSPVLIGLLALLILGVMTKTVIKIKNRT